MIFVRYLRTYSGYNASRTTKIRPVCIVQRHATWAPGPNRGKSDLFVITRNQEELKDKNPERRPSRQVSSKLPGCLDLGIGCFTAWNTTGGVTGGDMMLSPLPCAFCPDREDNGPGPRPGATMVRIGILEKGQRWCAVLKTGKDPGTGMTRRVILAVYTVSEALPRYSRVTRWK